MRTDVVAPIAGTVRTMTDNGTVDGRTRHYGTFYGLDPGDRTDTADADGLSDDLPVLLVWGNCQAEAVRVLLAASPSLQMRAVRIPPVFELTASDIDPLRRLAGRASVLLAQPVKDGHRDLPLGTAEVASLMLKGGTVVRWPVIRCSVLQPFQVIIRDPRDPTREPPVVPYHDLRTLASARTGKDLLAADIPIDGCARVAAASSPNCAGGKACRATSSFLTFSNSPSSETCSPSTILGTGS